MRIGKSGVFRCDFCGETIVGEMDFIRKKNQEFHFCEESEDEEVSCMDRYIYGYYCHDKIVDQVEEEQKKEFKLIYDRVCPSCKFRLRALV